MKKSSIVTMGRRSFLRGAGATMVGLPFLWSLQGKRAFADGHTHPKRLVVIHNPQGTLLPDWTPATTGPDYAMPRLLAPLEAHRDRMLVVSGVSNRTRYSQLQGNGHVPAGHSILTAHALTGSYDASGALRPRDDQPSYDTAYGPSIDQVVAERISEPGQRRSINLSVMRTNHENRLFWRGAPGMTELVANEDDPVRAFDAIFSGVEFPGDDPTPPTRQERFRARSSSVLDRVASSYDSLAGRMPAEDREAMARHARQIRRLEETLDAQIMIEGACARPEIPFPDDYVSHDQVWSDLKAQNHFELLAMALACDVTRVATVQFGNAHAPTFPFLDDYSIPLAGYTNWHDMVHKQGDPTSYDGLFRGFEWYATQVERLITKLATTPEGEGSLLDNTLVVWVSEFGNGGRHSTADIPVVLFGDLGGVVKTGEHLAFEDRTTNDLYIALLQAFGQPDTTFGLEVGTHARGETEQYVTGALEILV